MTKDEDFARRRAVAPRGPRIVWLRIPNTRRAALVERFASSHDRIVAALEGGEVLIEIA